MKKVFPFLVAFFLLFGGIFVWQKLQNPFPSNQKSATKLITVYLNSRLVQIEKGKTALDLLKKYAKIETKGEGSNAFVISIDGKKALSEKREYWAFYLNGKLAPVGAGSYQLKDGDKIEWKIEKY
jgi:hypothetical protein